MENLEKLLGLSLKILSSHRDTFLHSLIEKIVSVSVSALLHHIRKGLDFVAFVFFDLSVNDRYYFSFSTRARQIQKGKGFVTFIGSDQSFRKIGRLHPLPSVMI